MGLEVKREDAVELFRQLGTTTAGMWNSNRLAAKLTRLDRMVDGRSELGTDKAERLMHQVLNAIEHGDEIEVIGNKPPGPGQREPKKVKNKKKKFKGVRPTKTRYYLAGKVLKREGINKGITKEMMQEIDDEYGKPNDPQARIAMANAWHVLRGFFGMSVPE